VAQPKPFETFEAHNGAPPLIFANIAVVINAVASASHRCGYLENAVSILSTGRNTLYADHMCGVCQTQKQERYISTTHLSCPNMERCIRSQC
jgi:hypothetical protein